MPRSKLVIVVTIVALICAGLASMGAYNYLKQQEKKTTVTAVQQLVVSTVDVPVGAKLDIAQMKSVPMPTESYPPGGYKDPKELAGRFVVRYISAGDHITESKLVPKEGNSSGVMTYIIPKGHRAVTVAVNEVAGVAGFLSPNNRVDVVLTTTLSNGAAGDTLSKIVLQNVPILATGQVTEQKEGKPAVAPTVTMDLSPEDAEKLVHASHKGTLQLLLRNVLDTEQLAETGGTTISRVLGSSVKIAPVVASVPPSPPRPRPVEQSGATAKAAPVKAPEAPRHAVEIIKGKERTTKEFSGEVTK